MKPKVGYCDMVLRAQGVVTVTIIAKDYGMSKVKIKMLDDKRVILTSTKVPF